MMPACAADRTAAPDVALGRALVVLARGAIAVALGRETPPAPTHAALDALGATFVTLTQHGELRGCIGTLAPVRALGEDVRRNAHAAAFRDPRFSPLSVAEFGYTRVEVSLLFPSEPIAVAGEDDLLARLVPGLDGLILEFGRHRATFLPQVWESLPEPRQFVAALKRKAGLAADFWHADVSVARYRVAKWKEGETISPEAAPAASVGAHMSAAGPSQGTNHAPSGGSAAAPAASVGAHP